MQSSLLEQFSADFFYQDSLSVQYYTLIIHLLQECIKYSGQGSMQPCTLLLLPAKFKPITSLSKRSVTSVKHSYHVTVTPLSEWEQVPHTLLRVIVYLLMVNSKVV